MYFQSAIHPLAPLEAAMAKCTTSAECESLIELYLGLQREPDAIERRRIRMTVMGRAQSRPQLAEKLAEMNLQYADLFSQFLQPAVEKGWVKSDFDLRTVAIWFMGMVNNRAPMDFRPSDWDQDEMHRLYCSTILDAFIVRS
jgi:hypothetical protein